MAERSGRRAHRDAKVLLGLPGCPPNLSASWSMKRRGLGKDDLGPSAADRLRIAAGRHPGRRDNAVVPPASRCAGHRRRPQRIIMKATPPANVQDRVSATCENIPRAAQRHAPRFHLGLNCISQEKMVPRRGLEPPRPCDRQHLKLVRLPIPPSGHGVGGGL